MFSFMIRGDLSSSTPSIPPQTDLPQDFYDQTMVPGYGPNMCVLEQSDLQWNNQTATDVHIVAV